MIHKLYAYFNAQNKYSYYASILRIYLGFHLLKKYLLLYPYLNTLYSTNTYISWSKYYIFKIPNFWAHENYQIAVIAALLAGICIMIGAWTRIAFVVAFLAVDFLQRLNGYFLNGGDNLFKFVLLYMVFVQSDAYLAVLPRKIEVGTLNNAISNLGVLSIKIHLCLVYFTSAVAKGAATVWCNGTAVYYCLQLDRFRFTDDIRPLLQNDVLVPLLTYGTLLLELAIPFWLWDNSRKWIVMLGGVSMHIGIYLFMMIYDFEVLFISLYGLWITNEEWKYLAKRYLPERVGTGWFGTE